MPIDALTRRTRRNVAFLGTEPANEARYAFEQRDFAVLACSMEQFAQPEVLGGLAAAVLVQSETKPRRIVEDLATVAERLLDYDCRLIVCGAPNASGGRFSELIGPALHSISVPVAGLTASDGQGEPEEPYLPFVRYFDASVPWNDIANFVQTCPHRPAPNLALMIDAPGVDPANIAMSATGTALLQRAFSDCAHVTLETLEGARSGAEAYRTHAELADGLYGGTTQPFVVKIGPRDKIASEFDTYDLRVHPYVPFHLGPHLDYKRCMLGAKYGLLVMNFVSEGEELRSCASSGRAAAAIACLFNRALLGWHQLAEDLQVPLYGPLLGQFPSAIDRDRVALAREFGATLSIEELRGLFTRCDSTPVLVGPVHGDLHGRNVLVRAGDAIIIDVESHGKLPLLFDAATLEVGLLVEGCFPDVIDGLTWFNEVKALYDDDLFGCKAPRVAPSSWSAWLYGCVRQIRGFAQQLQCVNGQYAAVLALALLQKASKDPVITEPSRKAEEPRRAAAYAFAELVLRRAFPDADAAGATA